MISKSERTENKKHINLNSSKWAWGSQQVSRVNRMPKIE